MGRKPLFEKSEVLTAIHHWIVKYGIPPTIEELRTRLGVGSTRTVLRYLRQLEADGAITRWRGARGIELNRVPGRGTETQSIPIVGEISAGPLMLAEENIEGRVRLPSALVRGRQNTLFLLRVRGNSMNRAEVQGQTIEDGDLVLVQQQPTAEAGEIVVALIDGDATVKRLARGPNYFVLKPESSSPDHQPVVLQDEFQIQGVVQAVLKKGSELLE